MKKTMMATNIMIVVGITFSIVILPFTVLYSQPSAKAPITLKIGGSLPLTGGVSFWGIAEKRNFEIAVEEINQAGGIVIGGQKVNLQATIYDDEYSPERAVETSKRLVFDEKVKFIIGPMGSHISIAVQKAVVGKADVLHFDMGYNPASRGPQFPLSLGLFMPAELTVPGIVDWIAKNLPNATKSANINYDNAAGWEMAKIFKATAEKLNIQIGFSTFYPEGTEDFRPIIIKMMPNKPDFIMISSSLKELGLMQKQLYESGYKGFTTYTGPLFPDTLIKLAGAEAAEGHLAHILPEPGSRFSTPRLEALAKKYQQRFGTPLELFGVNVYDAVYTIKQGIEKAGSIEPAKVRDALNNMEIQSCLGLVRIGGTKIWGSKSQILFPVGLARIEKGKAVTVGTLSRQALEAAAGL